MTLPTSNPGRNQHLLSRGWRSTASYRQSSSVTHPGNDRLLEGVAGRWTWPSVERDGARCGCSGRKRTVASGTASFCSICAAIRSNVWQSLVRYGTTGLAFTGAEPLPAPGVHCAHGLAAFAITGVGVRKEHSRKNISSSLALLGQEDLR
jgi:hypothetical protein